MGDDRPNVYLEDGIAIYRASSLGGCQRALVAARLGMPSSPPPSWLQTIFDHGNRGEETITALLPEYGWRFDGEDQRAVELKAGPAATVRGHIDGAGTPYITESGKRQLSREQFTLEMKTMSPKVFASEWKRHGLRAFPRYLWQGSIYHHATGRPVMFVIGVKKDDGSGDVASLHFHRMTDEEIIPLGKIKARVLQTEALAKAGVPPETCDVPADGWCPMDYLHEGAEDAALEEVAQQTEPTDMEALVMAATEYAMAKEMEAEYARLKNEKRDRIDTLLGDRKGTIPVGDLIVTRSVSYRTNFDKRAAKAAHPEIPWDQYEIKSDDPTVTIKVEAKK